MRELVTDILDSGTTWVDRDGVEAPIKLDNILIIAPYNAQVFELQEQNRATSMLRAVWNSFTVPIA
ncbi:hypothetical protein [Bradyrhizobium arachidis]|uniref:hypothetical protein n=1 Tax=Bradyrhizobium arachidis TaxID=858423 RepID=UPI00216150B0|nr:hypothetical protein [Bradyrhizobium arachidis]